MITYILVGIICFLVGGAFEMSISDNTQEAMLKKNNDSQTIIDKQNKIISNCNDVIRFKNELLQVKQEEIGRLHREIKEISKKQSSSNNSQPQINIIIDGKNIEEFLNKNKGE